MTNWPAFLPNQIIVGNPESSIGIVCGWSEREPLRDRLVKLQPDIMDKVAGIGNLYTAERGLDMIFRNLLANPAISLLIFCGHDRSGATDEAVKYFNRERKIRTVKTSSGREYYAVADRRARVWADIPIEAVEAVRQGMAIYVAKSEEEVVRAVNSMHGVRALRCAWEPQVYEPVREEPTTFPAPDSVQVLRAKTVGEGYLELLHYILTYGKRIMTHYDQDSLEIMDLVMVITEQEAHPEMIPEYLPFNLAKINAYCVSLLSGEKDPNVSYTYGNRMRAYFGADQLMYVAEKLAKDRGSRSAVISLWDAGHQGSSSPCLNHIWFRIIEGKLFMTATIRSNDMFLGWPENAYGLRFVQDWVRCAILKLEGAYQDDKGLGMGDLVIVSQSAHLYEDCWGPAREIVDEHRRYKEWYDEKGQWTFETVDADGTLVIKAALHSREGEHLATIQGTPTHIRRTIARRGLISDVGHALYVGQMLERFQRSE